MCHILALLRLRASQEELTSYYSSILEESMQPKLSFSKMFGDGQKRKRRCGAAAPSSRSLLGLLSKSELALVRTGSEISCKNEIRYWFCSADAISQFKICSKLDVWLTSLSICFLFWVLLSGAGAATLSFLLIFLELFLRASLLPVADKLRVLSWVCLREDWTILIVNE